jgi:hypothetical protein
MRYLLVFALLASSSAFAAGKPQSYGITVRDPHFYKVFQKNTRMRCSYMRDKAYGLIAERGDSDEIRVILLKNGVAEGPATGWVGAIKKEDHTGTQVSRYSREGQYGRRFELVVGKRRSYEHSYGLPATLTLMTELWSKDEAGQDKKDLYLDGNFRLTCEPPLPL